jgi:preprotein translocase SecE subunit
MKTANLRKWTALLCTVPTVISLFALPVFAADENADTNKTPWGLIIGIAIGVVVLAVAVVLCIKFWDKIKKFLRVYKSEAGKIVWLPWSQTKKSTLVVLVLLVAFAVAIALIDLGLSEAFLAFIGLFQK